MNRQRTPPERPIDCQRYELIDGALHMSAAPAPLHQRAPGRLRSLVELKPPTATWYRRTDLGAYTVAGSATGTEPLRLTEPFEVEIVPADLVRRRT
jgi:hypothetical protein